MPMMSPGRLRCHQMIRGADRFRGLLGWLRFSGL
jgi:hypothetical protein